MCENIIELCLEWCYFWIQENTGLEVEESQIIHDESQIIQEAQGLGDK